MAQARTKAKYSFTIDNRTEAIINAAMKLTNAKSQSEAVDILCNAATWSWPELLKVSGITDQQKEAHKRAWLERQIEPILNEVRDEFKVMMGDMTTRIETKLTEIWASNQDEAREILHDDLEPKVTWDGLLEACPSVSEMQMTEWAKGREDDIRSTGHTILELVAAKMLGRKASVQTPVMTEDEKVNKVIENVSNKMVEYHIEKNKPNSMALPSKEFHVAHAVVRFDEMANNNGHGKDMEERLNQSLAKQMKMRQFGKDFLEQYEDIALRAHRIVEEQQAKGGLVKR